VLTPRLNPIPTPTLPLKARELNQVVHWHRVLNIYISYLCLYCIHMSDAGNAKPVDIPLNPPLQRGRDCSFERS
jgi:hypothetical protein